MIEYLSDDWFAAVDDLIGAPMSEMDHGVSMIVQHEVHGGPGGTRCHTQSFLDGRLVAWVDGNSNSPDLVVRRSYEVDRDDLLSRGRPASIAESTELSSAAISSGDIFGIYPNQALGLALPEGLEITIGLACPDTAFGALERRYLLSVNRLHPTTDQSDVVVIGPFERVLRWLHDEQTLLGHLLVVDEYESAVEGDYFKMSAVEGCISASRDQSTAGHMELLRSYATCRRDQRSVETLDQLDAITA